MAAPWGAIIQAAASNINTGMNMAQNFRAQKREFKEAARVRDWQTAEREAQNEWNLEQWNRENEWNLAQWNRENAYNTPEAQYERFSKLGYSPLAFLGQQSSIEPSMHISSPEMTSASAPMGAQGRALNPPQIDMFGNVGELFNQWKMQRLESQRVANETAKTDTDIRNVEFQKMWQGLINGKNFELMGVQIETEKQRKKLTEQEAKATAQGILNAQTELKQMKVFMAQMNAQMTRWDVQNACDRVNADNSIKALASQIWLNQKIGYNIRQDTINKFDEGMSAKYRAYGDYWNAKEAERSHKYNARWEFKSDFNINVMNGMKVVNSVIEPLLNVSRIGMQSAITRVQNQNYKMMLDGMQSQRNPIGFTY